MLRVSIALAAVVGFVASAQAATVVPTVYEAGHFFATPTLANGQVLRLLVDTGGGGINYWLQESTAARLGLLISHWHDAHPNWAVLDNADGLIGPKRAIRVPSVEIGGWAVGPVWFVERPNANFEQVMSSMMDGTVHGAIGANVLSSFRMTLDYVHATAWLSCVERCEASVPATK
jgi:hypothetical protein